MSLLDRFRKPLPQVAPPPPDLSDYLMLGHYPPDPNDLALLHRRILEKHAYLSGWAGRGKTRMLINLSIQLARVNRAKGEQPAPMVFIDLKGGGEFALFNTARLEAERRGQQLQFFTIRSGKDSYGFNPFQNLNASDLTPIELADVIIQGLGKFYGDFYGAAYYGGQNRYLLLDVLLNLRRLSGRSPESLAEVFRYVLEKRGAHKDAAELIATLHALTQYPLISDPNEWRPGTKSIHFPELISKGQIAYFWLPAAISALSTRHVGKLIMYCLLCAAIDHQQKTGKAKRVYVLIDEFQQIAAQNLELVLNQSRSSGLSLILTSQLVRSLDPEPGARNVRDLMMALPYKQFFSPLDELDIMNEITLKAGEKIEWREMRSQGERFNSDDTHSLERSQRWVQERRPRLTADDLREITVAEGESLLWITQDLGFTKTHGIPRRLCTTWALSEQEYDERHAMGWPDLPPAPPVPPATKTGQASSTKTTVLNNFLTELMKQFDRDRDAIH